MAMLHGESSELVNISIVHAPRSKPASCLTCLSVAQKALLTVQLACLLRLISLMLHEP